MKRKAKKTNTNDSKRIKITTEYNAASTVHNFMLHDTILDWLKYKKQTKRNFTNTSNTSNTTTVTTTTTSIISSSTEDSNDRFFNFITEQGKKFENHVIEIIKDKEDIKNENKYQETKNAIANQIDVIYQGVLHGNNNFKAFGSPDLLIRSDIVDKLFDVPIDNVPKNNKKFNYVVIDIKFCTLKLRADGKFLLNDARMPANKAQVMIYNKLLGIAQNYEPKYCYILGRGWKYTKKNEYFECTRFDERLGCIDVKDKDSMYTEKISEALKWLELVKKEGHSWEYNPPSVPELYPNMSNRYDNDNKEKKKIAVEIDEITQLWNCGVKQRLLAHEQGIYKLSDPRLTTQVMGFPQGTNRTKLIDKMLKFNQGLIGKSLKVIPKYIDNNPYDWQNNVHVEFFLDFELFSNMFDDFQLLPNIAGPGINSDCMNIVFMAGLGVSIKTLDGKTKWEYYNFRVQKLSDDHEYEMFNNLYSKIQEFCNKYNIKIENAKIFHWGHIEQSTLNKIYEKYYDKHDWENLLLIDFCKLFQNEGILIKGVYGFGLKEIGKGLINHGLINIPSWDDNITNGLDAMVQAYNIYSNPEQNHETTINDIIKYNHTDVRMIEKIINYLRKNHTPL
jgi:hypothetical protein